MKRDEFEYDLPEARIAQVPLKDRTAARLLVLERASGQVVHTRFGKLHEFLRAGDLLVLNDTRVTKCRLLGRRAPGGGKVELFLLRRLEDGFYESLGRASRPLRPGSRLLFGDGLLRALVLKKHGRKLVVSLTANGKSADEALEQVAELPLPPYIKRPHGPDEADEVFYQTVYSSNPGAVAAPTAGLHFATEYLEELRGRGVEFAHITVHTGLGSFQPIRTDHVEDHEVPAEEFRLAKSGADAINRAKERGRRVIAVGTSCVRALETVADRHKVKPGSGQTDLYITPGHEFSIVDAMITNFHQPCSPLIVLVSAFAGRVNILSAYREALEREYRFLSFGDAMLIM